MSKAWFESWFNTRYYHILYSHRDEGEAKGFMTNLMDFLQIPLESEVIDIGCGRGRHARFLSAMGYNVTGIDIADSSIEYAKQYECENLHFFCFDKRKIFKKGKYDLALNLFTSFGFLRNRSELEIALISMSENIKKGGILVMDYMNAEKIKHASFEEKIIHENGIHFNIGKKIKGHQIIKTIRVRDRDKSLDFREQVHLISLEEFKALYAIASLKILHTFGDYQLNKFNSENSDRLILIAEKQ